MMMDEKKFSKPKQNSKSYAWQTKVYILAKTSKFLACLRMRNRTNCLFFLYFPNITVGAVGQNIYCCCKSYCASLLMNMIFMNRMFRTFFVG